MKTKHHRIMIILQAIFSLNRNTLPKSENSYMFNMNVIHINVNPLCIASLLTFNNILSCIRKVLDKCHAQSTDFTRQRRIVKVYKLIFFYFFINSIPTLMKTALKALKKTVQMYEIMYNFCTVLISENSIKLEGNHRECIVK